MSNSGVITRQPHSTDSVSTVPKSKSSENMNDSNMKSNIIDNVSEGCSNKANADTIN